MDIRQLQYLIALARERHFTRAAEACGITQPTLSERIRQLEEELGVQIVLRGQRYHGLTQEGERVLRWARRIVEDCDGMLEDIAVSLNAPEGRLTLGVIPSALPVMPHLAAELRKIYPRVRFTILSQTSRQIARDLEEFAIDAGITYLDNEPVKKGLIYPLYQERYRLFVRDDHPLADYPAISWSEVAAHKLCALTPDMQNRRIIDDAFSRTGHKPQFEVESNSVIALCSFVQTGLFASILPEYFMTVIGEADRIRTVPLVDPLIEHVVGLVTLDSDPLPALVGALVEAAGSFKPEGLYAARQPMVPA